jgi:hypothetical protein
MLQFFRLCLWKVVEGLFDIAWYGEVHGSLKIIPGEFDSTEERSFPVSGDSFVMIIQGVEGVLGVYCALILDPKVVNHYSKLNGAPGMLPEAWSVLGLEVPTFGKATGQ